MLRAAPLVLVFGGIENAFFPRRHSLTPASLPNSFRSAAFLNFPAPISSRDEADRDLRIVEACKGRGLKFGRNQRFRKLSGTSFQPHFS
jgi:hypothetical protein